MTAVAGAAVFTLTILLIFLSISAGCTGSIYSDWRKNQDDAAKRRRRGRLWSPAFTCCFSIFALLAALTVFAILQLRSDVSLFAYDPWADLGLPEGTKDATAIKQAYRGLSKQYHPDKPGGDAKKFQKIARAYHTLTDEQALRNFHEYGNPEGKFFNVAEVPGWLSAAGGGNAKDAGKRKALLVMGGLVGMLLLVVLCGGWVTRNRSLLNSLELGVDADPLKAFQRMSATERQKFMNAISEARAQGMVDNAEYNDWVDIYNQVIALEKEAAALKAAGSGTPGSDSTPGKAQTGGSAQKNVKQRR